MIEDNSFVFQKEIPANLIKETFTEKDRLYLNTAIKQGYKLTNDLMTDTNWLSALRGSVLEPRLKSIASEFMVVQYIQRGLLPFMYRIDKNLEGNHQHMLFYDKNNTINFTLNQVPRKANPSSYAKYKVQKYSHFESYFDFETSEIVDEQPIYLELNHGYQSVEPNFVVLGIPKSSKNWYACEVLSDGLFLQNNIEERMQSVEEPMEDFSVEDFRNFMIGNDF